MAASSQRDLPRVLIILVVSLLAIGGILASSAPRASARQATAYASLPGASIGTRPRFISRAIAHTSWVSVRFELRAGRNARVTLVQFAPSDLSVLVIRGRLELRAGSRRVVLRLPLSVHPAAVSIVADAEKHFATVKIGNQRERGLRISLTRVDRVRLRSLDGRPGRRSRTSADTVSLNRVVVSSAGRRRPATPAPAGSPSPQGTDAAGAGPLFSPTSIWNATLPATAPLDPSSAAMVNELDRQAVGDGTWINTTSYSTPVYTVPANQPTVHVTLDTWGPDLQQQFNAVPLPANATAAAGTDKHLVVWQPSTDKMWEFWVMQYEADGWHARWGGEMDSVSISPGYFTHTGLTKDWGATATGLPLLGGLVTLADLSRGYINHALAIALPETETKYWSWPAQRTDGGGWTKGATTIPEGTQFRLNPNLNIASLNLPPIDRMLAQAAQKYGIVVRDKAGAVVFYGQDPLPTGANPWPTAFQNQWPNHVLALFPWTHLEVLKAQLSCCWGP